MKLSVRRARPRGAGIVIMVAVGALTVGTLSIAAAAPATGPVGAPVGDFSGTGPPYQLVFSSQPAASTAAGSPLSLVVSVEDQLGQVVASDSGTAVMLSITPGTGTLGAPLLCAQNPVTDASGLSSFDCSIPAAGNGYELTATSVSGLVAAITTPFDVSSATPTKLAIVTKPSSRWVAGKSAAVKIAIENASGDVVTTSTRLVTLAISIASRDFKCTANPATPISGVASFSCTMSKSGTSYSLTATGTGLQSAKSTSFEVASATASKLGFARQPPARVRAGAWFSFQVGVEDRFGNLVGASHEVVRVSRVGRGATSLVCTHSSMRVVGGRARFVCKVSHVVRRLMIRASGAGVLSATSTALSVV